MKKVAAPICVVLAIDSEDIGITQAPGSAEGSGGCFSTNAAVWKNKGHHSQLSLRMKSPLQCFTYKTCSSATACHIRLPSYRRGRDEDRLGRSSRGRASLTTSGRPPNSLPSKPFMAARPSESLLIVTNAKPRGWPVSRSVMTLISVTLPNCSNICWRSASVMVNEIFPT